MIECRELPCAFSFSALKGVIQWFPTRLFGKHLKADTPHQHTNWLNTTVSAVARYTDCGTICLLTRKRSINFAWLSTAQSAILLNTYPTANNRLNDYAQCQRWNRAYSAEWLRSRQKRKSAYSSEWLYPWQEWKMSVVDTATTQPIFNQQNRFGSWTFCSNHLQERFQRLANDNDDCGNDKGF